MIVPPAVGRVARDGTGPRRPRPVDARRPRAPQGPPPAAAAKTSKIFPERSKMRMTISRSKAWTALAVGAFVAPTVLGAQDSTTKQPAAPAAQQLPQVGRS